MSSGVADGGREANALRVLVVEDEQSIVDFLTLGLRYERYDVAVCKDGGQALKAFADARPDLVILDILLPGMDGVEICRRIRKTADTPVIMLTARDELDDRITGLDSGADDYLTKPFEFRELMARIRAVLRRRGVPQDEVEVASLALNRATREVWREGLPVELSPKEFDLLELLMSHPRQVFGRDAILNRVWGYEWAGNTNVVDVYISYLRAKVDNQPPHLIQTVRGVGYALRPPKL
ncbi:MAG: response regulator [Chloroflexota bacterium]